MVSLSTTNRLCKCAIGLLSPVRNLTARPLRCEVSVVVCAQYLTFRHREVTLMPFCTACGHEGSDTARFCNGCGQQMPVAAPPTSSSAQTLPPTPSQPTYQHPQHQQQHPPGYQQLFRPEKSKSTATVLAWLLGGLGVSDFYLGNIGKGIVKLLTLGGFGIWALIDAIKLLTMSQQEFDQRYNIWEVPASYSDVRQSQQQQPRQAQRPPTHEPQAQQSEYRKTLQINQPPPVPTISAATPPPAPIPVTKPSTPTPSTPPPPRGDTLIAIGVNGQIELAGNRVRITRKGFMGFLTQGLKGDKEILISQISSIQYRPAGDFARGYIQFAFLGSQESKAGLLDSVTDENSVLFDKEQQPEFDELKRRIDAVRDQLAMPGTAISAAVSELDELEKLASLHQRGILTDAEFDAKKKEILGV